MRCLNCAREGLAISSITCPDCGIHLPSLMRDLLPSGTILHEKYSIDYPLGRGGFGVTYRAIHIKTEQPLAIKEFFPQEYAVRQLNTGKLSVLEKNRDNYERGLQRFLKEAKTLAMLEHPNIVRVQDFFEERGTAYIVMELIRGRTLRAELEQQTSQQLSFSSSRVKEIFDALVNALTEAHAVEIYHLDLKPENVLLTSKGRVVLVDFGAAKQGMSSPSTQAFTLDYAAPEVISNKEVGPESDLFELGMMLYEMLTGTLPPNAMSRLLNNNWKPMELEQPWQTLVEEALRLEKQKRPKSLKDWWDMVNSTPPFPTPTATVSKQLPETLNLKNNPNKNTFVRESNRENDSAANNFFKKHWFKLVVLTLILLGGFYLKRSYFINKAKFAVKIIKGGSQAVQEENNQNKSERVQEENNQNNFNKAQGQNTRTNEKKVLVVDPPSNIRSYPNGSIICTIEQRKTISVYSWTNGPLPTSWSPDAGWFSTDACGKDKEAWIHGSQIKFFSLEDERNKENATWAHHGIVMDPPSNIRDKPNGKILCQVKEKNGPIAVKVNDKIGDWFKVWTYRSDISQPCVGYIHNSQFKIVTPNDSFWHSLFR